MVKTANGRYALARRRYWRRNAYSFLKAIRTYHYVKLSVTDMIEYAGSTIKFASNNGSYASVSDILAGCPDFKIYRDLYVSLRVRSISVQVTPLCNMENFIGATAAIALLASNEPANISTCTDSDHSLVLNPNQFCSMYWKCAYPWANSNDASESFGQIGLAIAGSTTQGAMRWTVKFTFYVMYKTNS